MVDQKSCRIQHHQHFRSQRFGHRLSGFLGDGRSDFGFSFVQPALKLAQNCNPSPRTNLRPGDLRRTRPRHGSSNLTFTCGFKFAQNRARRRI